MRNIVFIAHSSDFYGAEKVLYQVIAATRGKYKIHVILPKAGEMARRLETFPDVACHYISLPRFSLIPKDIIFTIVTFLPFILSFKKFLFRLDPALVYGNTIRSAIPVAVARKFGYATLIHYHESNLPGRIGKMLAKLADTAAKRKIFVCHFALESYTKFSADLERTSTVIHNGIVPLLDSQGQIPQIFIGKEPRFISVAQLESHKRIGDLLEAMAIIRQTFPLAMLVVLGEGQLRTDLEFRSKELGLENQVQFPGYLSDISPLLSAADVFLAPFEKEACNMAVIEAMSAGKPVVATEGGGMPELVLDGETGLTFPTGNIPELIERMTRLSLSVELQKRFGAAGKQRVLDKFNLQIQMGLIQQEIMATADREEGVIQ